MTMQHNAKEVNSHSRPVSRLYNIFGGYLYHLAFWSQQHAALATCKGLRIDRLQYVIWTTFLTITSNALVPAYFHTLKLLSAHLVVVVVYFGMYFLLSLLSCSSPIESHRSTTFLFNFNDLRFFSVGSTFFLMVRVTAICGQSPIPIQYAFL